MGTISVSLPSDGSTADVSDYNTPLNTIVDEINGNLDNANIASDAAIVGSKLAADTIDGSRINFAATGADSGIWWEELGRTTLSGAGDTISVTPIAARKYLRVLVYCSATGGTINATLRFNNDSGSNYSARSSTNGSADGTGVSATSMGLSATASTAARIIELTILNVASIEKLVSGHCLETGTAGAGNTTSRAEIANKWVNTADQITRVDIVNSGTGDFAIGSEVVVLGHN